MDCDIAVLYGSQTGNAEDMARRIGYKVRQCGHSVLVQAMDDYRLKQLPRQNIVFFVCSTTGHGQAPENMINFYNFIRRSDLPRDCLTSLNYAVFGLGDSSYEKFNWVSKILFKRLRECGANPLQELTAGDEQHRYGCDGIIYPNLEQLLQSIVPQSGRESPEESLIPISSYQVTLGTVKENSDPEERVFSDEFIAHRKIKTARCISNQRVTSNSHFQDTRFLRFKADNVCFEPGDSCAIFPANTDENVEKFAQLLSLDLNTRLVCVDKRDENFMVNHQFDYIPEHLSTAKFIKYYLDIQSVPRRSFFEFLWPFSDDELEREKLKEFASTIGQEELYEYCVQPKRSIFEVLMDFPNTIKNIQFDYLLDMIPPIKPRSFSIASSPCSNPNELHLIVGRVEYKTRMKKSRQGLCSNYLARMSPESDQIRYFLNKTNFKLPDDNTPIIMVGPGLGIAPFRSFLQRRIDSRNTTKNYLYFGCRRPSSDYYFHDELEGYSDDGSLYLRVAFSRASSKKQYVQGLIKQDSEMIKELILDEKAYFYVAGNSKLPEDIRNLLCQIVPQTSIASLEANHMIQYDCW